MRHGHAIARYSGAVWPAAERKRAGRAASGLLPGGNAPRGSRLPRCRAAVGQTEQFIALLDQLRDLINAMSEHLKLDPAGESQSQTSTGCYELFSHRINCKIGVVKNREIGPVPS